MSDHRNDTGGMASPTLFNVAVYRTVRHWISITVEENVAIHDILVMAVGRCMGVMYSHGGMIVSRDPKWFQGAINVLNLIFSRVRLMEKRRKVQYHDFPARGDLHRDIIGSVQL